MNGFAPEEVTQRGADPAAAAAAVVGNAGSAVEVPPPPPAPPGLGPAVAVAAGSVGAGGAGGPGAGQLCCLREEGERCGRAAGNASFSKRIQKSISQKKVKIELDKSARHLYICDFHKNLIQSVRNRRKRKGSDDDGDSPVQDIDTPEIIGCHFRTIPVNEKDTLAYFIYSVKNEKNKPDLKMDSGVH
ncbi:histone deacetylase complex subunit SAP30 isoform X2 [Strigops habroptila]|uniref:histone deacetylase complex subunit SAP30 isoform X2 n=1 Tax=Strigops habroptila TaxID=2489341 RepID=UPI0011CFAE01|nr:histone deacetylase complex subunit SAP30 isoform X2 [Strigops habroptila]